MKGRPAGPITDRLWSRVDCSGEHWLWRGAATGGYGRINTGRHGKTMLVHRLVWMLFYGDPGELHVLHRCDTPACCRPEHLFLGTQEDNMRDMDAKKRCVRIGERRRKLSLQQLEEVMSSTESSRVIGERLGVQGRTIRKIRQRGGYHGASPHEARW